MKVMRSKKKTVWVCGKSISDDLTPFDFDFQIQPQQGSNTREKHPIPSKTPLDINRRPQLNLSIFLSQNNGCAHRDRCQDPHKFVPPARHLLHLYPHLFPILDKFNILRTLRTLTQSQSQIQSIPPDQLPLHAILALSILQ
jgi:hypothetical protein